MVAIIVPLLALAIIVIVLWTAIRAIISDRRNPPRIESTTRSEQDGRRIAEALRDALSQKPLGAPLAGNVWRKLMNEAPGKGVIYGHHRDFCGQGLIRTKDGVMLCDVLDGGDYFGEPIAQWTRDVDFVAFFAGQSDFSLSGWDRDESVFFTDDEWYRSNQRLTRAVLERYLSRL